MYITSTKSASTFLSQMQGVAAPFRALCRCDRPPQKAMMLRARMRTCLLLMLLGVCLLPHLLCAAIPGVAPGIPEPAQRNVIVQLFNWRFTEIAQVIPRLRELGYSHIHVSPPQHSNERVWQWWGRYQPIDFSVINGPLGTEPEFQAMTEAAHRHGLQIIVDVVLNHTVDVTELPSPDFVIMANNCITREQFPQFEPDHFHCRCPIHDSDLTSVRTCWLSNTVADLKTEVPHVRHVAKQYLRTLVALGADGFRFDAAKHIEPDFFSDVLSVVPGAYAFGEVITPSAANLPEIAELDFYDFPLVAALREAFGFGGNLALLKEAQGVGRALPGVKAVTFVRNHDIDRGQANDRGLDDSGGRTTFGVGWDETHHQLDRTDVALSYAFILGREEGFPYIFVDMPTLPPNQQDDRFDASDLVAGIRFHNLCLAHPDGSDRRPDIWRIETSTTIGWQRGRDRFIVINKAAESYAILNLQTSLQPGTYLEVRTGWPLHVQSDATIREWQVPPRSAMRFVRVGD
jgi:alpha-amylase